MHGEAAPLIEHFHLRPVAFFKDFIPMKAFQNQFQQLTISLIINGKDHTHGTDNIGTQPAVLSTYLAIEHFQPDLIINAGTAGGFRERGMVIGDVVVAQGKAFFHDRRIPIPAYESYGLGGYPLLDLGDMISFLGLKTATISTGNSFDFNDQDKKIMESLQADIKDMEAASVAWVANLADIPLMIVKSVTDYVSLIHPSEEEFIQNFMMAINNLKDTVIRIIQYLAKE